jgi:hypothetical protein
MSARNRIVAACSAIALVPGVAACTGGGSAQPQAAGLSVQTVAPSTAATIPAMRWWSNGAAVAGSSIDKRDPAALAARLHSSQEQYCSMLRQTVRAGRTILPNVTAKDPALLTSTTAFLAELEAVAPARVAGPWRVVGSAVITLVASGGDASKVHGVDAAAVRKAVSTVAADAKHSCGVDLSS